VLLACVLGLLPIYRYSGTPLLLLKLLDIVADELMNTMVANKQTQISQTSAMKSNR
jgi:hypothetical protein